MPRKTTRIQTTTHSRRFDRDTVYGIQSLKNSRLAILLSLLAVIIAFIALNQQLRANAYSNPPQRPNSRTAPIVGNQPQSSISNATQLLENLKIQISSGDTNTTTRTQDELARIQDSLREAFPTGSAQDLQSKNLNIELQDIQEKLRSGSITALDAIDRALQALRTALQTK